MSTHGDTTLRDSPEPVPPVHDDGASDDAPRHGHWMLLVLILVLVCLFMRLTGLMLLPIFGDEAIYLRWAQLIRGEGLSAPASSAMFPWVSLADPKPPLHFWLLALVFHASTDPLLAARHISVAAGVMSLPLIYLVGVELGSLIRERGDLPVYATGRVLGLLAAILVIFCPFLSFYHRLATADALFVTESLAIVWLSLRWGRLATGVGRGARTTAVGLGVVIGAALMTRQGLSYTLALMPGIAWVTHAVAQAKPLKSKLLRSAGQLGLAAVIAAALWTPYLLAELHPRALELKREKHPEATIGLLTSSDLQMEVKRRIFYQDKFTERASTADVAKRNFALAFIPGLNDRGVVSSGWFFHYLTPAVYLASVGGLIYLGVRRQWLLLVVLGAWLVLALGPVIAMANVIFSRYVLAGVPPLLVAAAFLVGDVLGILFKKYAEKPAIAWVAAAGMFGAMLLPGLIELGRQGSNWRDQHLTGQDNYQYISGWSAGKATEQAIISLLDLTSAGPIIVITDNGWGTPADAIWVYLSNRPNIQLYYTDREQILDRVQPVSAGPGTGQTAVVWLRANKFLYPPYEQVTLPRDVPILYVTKEGAHPVIERLRASNPNIMAVETFKGVINPRNGESDPEGSVTIFQLPRPVQ